MMLQRHHSKWTGSHHMGELRSQTLLSFGQCSQNQRPSFQNPYLRRSVTLAKHRKQAAKSYTDQRTPQEYGRTGEEGTLIACMMSRLAGRRGCQFTMLRATRSLALSDNDASSKILTAIPSHTSAPGSQIMCRHTQHTAVHGRKQCLLE